MSYNKDRRLFCFWLVARLAAGIRGGQGSAGGGLGVKPPVLNPIEAPASILSKHLSQHIETSALYSYTGTWKSCIKGHVHPSWAYRYSKSACRELSAHWSCMVSLVPLLVPIRIAVISHETAASQFSGSGTACHQYFPANSLSWLPFLVPSLLDAVLIAHSCLSNLNYGYRRTGMLVCVPCVRFQAAGGGGGQARVSGF